MEQWNLHSTGVLKTTVLGSLIHLNKSLHLDICFSVTKRNNLYCIVLVITHKCFQKSSLSLLCSEIDI